MKVGQQSLALRVALYILRMNGFHAPTKKHVLNFIRIKHLLDFPEHELAKRHESDIDEIWANDIAWKRKNLFEDGQIDSPKRGCWRLTEAGMKWVESRKDKWSKLRGAENRQQALDALEYWTPELLDWMLKIAKGEDLHLK